jgi:hypothetical protein
VGESQALAAAGAVTLLDRRVEARRRDRDEDSHGQSSDVPGASDSLLAIFPPLLLRRDSDGHYSGVKGNAATEAGQAGVSLTALFLFDVREFSPSFGEPMGGSPKVLAMVICALDDIAEPELELSFFLKEATSGVEIAIPHSALDLSDLGPGAYILKVTAKERTMDLEAGSA